MDKSLFQNGRSVLAADVRTSEERYAAQAADTRASRRAELRIDKPAVDPALIPGARGVFVRGRGWFFVKTVNKTTVTGFRIGLIGFERIPFAQIVDVQ